MTVVVVVVVVATVTAVSADDDEDNWSGGTEGVFAVDVAVVGIVVGVVVVDRKKADEDAIRHHDNTIQHSTE